MENYGKKQGDMSPEVKNYQRPDSVYSQKNMGKTTEYISRHNAHESKEASQVKKQAYKGRYE